MARQERLATGATCRLRLAADRAQPAALPDRRRRTSSCRWASAAAAAARQAAAGSRAANCSSCSASAYCARPAARPDVRRRAAARGDRGRPRQQPVGDPRRRADRRARLRHRRGCLRARSAPPTRSSARPSSWSPTTPRSPSRSSGPSRSATAGPPPRSCAADVGEDGQVHARGVRGPRPGRPAAAAAPTSPRRARRSATGSRLGLEPRPHRRAGPMTGPDAQRSRQPANGADRRCVRRRGRRRHGSARAARRHVHVAPGELVARRRPLRARARPPCSTWSAAWTARPRRGLVVAGQRRDR